MKKRVGFTVVEVVIIIAVLGILTGLAVVSMRSSLPQSRDSERRGDVNNIAVHLDSLAANGYPGGVSIAKGSYPSTAHLSSPSAISSVLADLNTKSLTSPSSPSGTISLVMATNSNTTTAGVTPQPTPETYVYQPLAADSSLCALANTECRRFIIYYKLESGAIETKLSRNQ